MTPEKLDMVLVNKSTEPDDTVHEFSVDRELSNPGLAISFEELAKPPISLFPRVSVLVDEFQDFVY